MEITQRTADSFIIIDVAGDLDLYNAKSLKEAVNQAVSSRIGGLILNLEKVKYIDSRGIGVLIYCNSLLKSNLTPLRIAHVHGSVRRVVELTKLYEFLPIVESEEIALEQLRTGD